MPAPIRLVCLFVASAFALLLGPTNNTFGQRNPRQQDQAEVVRVYTDLVQTDVTVFDRAGRFADGLRKEDFELKIDGKVRPIDFFERVTVGTANEESQLRAARGNSSPDPLSAAVPLDRGRTIFFYVDDMHLGAPSLAATLRMITRFVDQEMGQNDEVGISSASGAVGFLQQLTDNKAVLRAALGRIKFRSNFNRDPEYPPMTEYLALLIDRYDRGVTDYFVEETVKRNPGLNRQSAENIVRGRASALLQPSSNVTRITLAGLEGLVKASRDLPGRKLVFFISDGFFIDHRNSDTPDRLRRITSDAAKSGVVIYSLDARGLIAPFSDPTMDASFDTSGRLTSATQGELFASQDALNGLARDTGGRPFFGSNSLDAGLSQALKETSVYYLLAWKPMQGTQQASKFRRIEVRLPDKPELTARVRRGFFDVDPEVVDAKKDNKKQAANTTEAKIREAIGAPYPNRGLPIALSLTYLNAPEGMQLSSSMEIPGEFLKFGPEDGKEKAAVRLAGSFFNDRGQPGAHFSERVTLTALTGNSMKDAGELVQYTYPVNLGPGLYHVRVAALDEKSGRAGSAHGWVEIPDLSSRQLATSSLIIGARNENAVTNNSTSNQSLTENVRFSVDHIFKRDSYIRFFIFIYNAKRGADSLPDVATQVQILRDNQPVITTALKKIATEGVDLERLPYAADLSLAGLQTGRYVVQVTVIDRVSKTSVSQQVRLGIE